MRGIVLACLACAALSPMTVAEARPTVSEPPCGKDAWNKFVPDLVAAQSAFVRGDPASMKALWSHAEDVTLMGAWGGRERGWALVGARLDWVSKSNTEGKGTYDDEEVRFDRWIRFGALRRNRAHRNSKCRWRCDETSPRDSRDALRRCELAGCLSAR